MTGEIMPDKDVPHGRSASAPARREREGNASHRRRGRTIWRWIVIAAGIFLFALMMREVLFPFRGQLYVEIGHGNHTHYLPKDRNETVPVSAFPMRPPGPGERLTPDGDIVPKK